MNDRTVDTAVSEVMELIIEDGFNGMDRAFSILFNEAMKVERSRALRADPYERTGQRLGYANGFHRFAAILSSTRLPWRRGNAVNEP